MAIGTALAIALGAQAGLGALGARKQAKAAEKAAATQSASADKAMALQAQLAQQAMAGQNQMMYGGGGGGGGGFGSIPGGGGMAGGIQGMYSPYVSSAPATLSALHEYLGIPGAAQAQTMVPYGGYGQPMRQPFLGQPGGGGPPMAAPRPGMMPMGQVARGAVPRRPGTPLRTPVG